MKSSGKQLQIELQPLLKGTVQKLLDVVSKLLPEAYAKRGVVNKKTMYVINSFINMMLSSHR